MKYYLIINTDVSNLKIVHIEQLKCVHQNREDFWEIIT